MSSALSFLDINNNKRVPRGPVHVLTFISRAVCQNCLVEATFSADETLEGSFEDLVCGVVFMNDVWWVCCDGERFVLMECLRCLCVIPRPVFDRALPF
jgi:hypothetical protein